MYICLITENNFPKGTIHFLSNYRIFPIKLLPMHSLAARRKYEVVIRYKARYARCVSVSACVRVYVCTRACLRACLHSCVRV